MGARASNIFGRGGGCGPFRDRLATVAGVAQALEVGRIEEYPFISLVWLDMVYVLRFGTDSASRAFSAKRFRCKLLGA